MASIFKSVIFTPTSTSTMVYKTPAKFTSIVFSVIICNTSDSREGNIFMKMKVGGNISTILHNVDIPLRSSLAIPKFVIPEGGELYINSSLDSSASLNVNLSLFETIQEVIV